MKILGMLKTFATQLLIELVANGKMLVSYLLLQIPALNGYPMLVGAINDFAANPNKQTFAAVMVQAVMAFGAGHRFVKILANVLLKRMTNG